MAARGEAQQADVEVSTLVVPAWRLRWRAPELALVLGERAVALASTRRDEVDRLRAEALVVFASNRMGRGVRIADRALDALKAAEAASERETAWRLRVELADSARSVGAPLTGFAAVRPVLEADDVPPGLRATALVQASECLVSVGRGAALAQALDEADHLYQADPLLDHDTTLLHRGLLRASAAGQHRRWGDLPAAVAAARDGLAVLDRLKEAESDNGQVRGRLTVELVCALMDLNKPGEASEIGTPLLERPVRAPSASTTGWLRLALATRVHLPAGRVDQARDLLRDAADSAERHQLDTLLAESLLALAHVHEVAGDLAEALANLRSAHTAERRRARAVYAVRARLAAEFSGVHRKPAGGLHDELAALLRTGTPAAMPPTDPDLATEAKQQLRQWRPVQMHRNEGVRVKRSRRAAEDMTVDGISAARAHAADRWRLVQPFGEAEGDDPQPGGRRRAPEPEPETPPPTQGRPEHARSGQAKPTNTPPSGIPTPTTPPLHPNHLAGAPLSPAASPGTPAGNAGATSGAGLGDASGSTPTGTGTVGTDWPASSGAGQGSTSGSAPAGTHAGGARASDAMPTGESGDAPTGSHAHGTGTGEPRVASAARGTTPAAASVASHAGGMGTGQAVAGGAGIGGASAASRAGGMGTGQAMSGVGGASAGSHAGGVGAGVAAAAGAESAGIHARGAGTGEARVGEARTGGAAAGVAGLGVAGIGGVELGGAGLGGAGQSPAGTGGGAGTGGVSAGSGAGGVGAGQAVSAGSGLGGDAAASAGSGVGGAGVGGASGGSGESRVGGAGVGGGGVAGVPGRSGGIGASAGSGVAGGRQGVEAGVRRPVGGAGLGGGGFGIVQPEVGEGGSAGAAVGEGGGAGTAVGESSKAEASSVAGHEGGERSVSAAGLIAAAGAVRSGRRRAAREAAEEEGERASGDADPSVLDTLKAAGLLDPQRAGGRRRAPDADEEATVSEPEPTRQAEPEQVQWRVEPPPRLRGEAPPPPVDMFDSPTMVQPAVRDDVPPVGLGAAFVKGPLIPTARVPDPPDYPLPPVPDFAMSASPAVPEQVAKVEEPKTEEPTAEESRAEKSEAEGAKAEVRPVFPPTDVDSVAEDLATAVSRPEPWPVSQPEPRPVSEPESMSASRPGLTAVRQQPESLRAPQPEPTQPPAPQPEATRLPVREPEPTPAPQSVPRPAPALAPQSVPQSVSRPAPTPARQHEPQPEPDQVPGVPEPDQVPPVPVPEPVPSDPFPGTTPPAQFSPTGFLGAADVEHDDAPATSEKTGAGTGDETGVGAGVGAGGEEPKEPFVTAVVVGGKTIDLPAIVVEPTPPAPDSPSATRASRRHKSDLSLAELLAEALVAYEDARREDEAAGRAEVDEATVPISPVGTPPPESENETTAPIQRVDPPRRFDTWTLPES